MASLLAGMVAVLGGASAASTASVDPGTWYETVNRNSGKALDVCTLSTADGAAVVHYSDWDGANQQWQLVPAEGGDPGDLLLPSSFQWSSSGVLAGPQQDASHPDNAAIKDYTVVRHNGEWQVCFTTASRSNGWNRGHFAFPDRDQAAGTDQTFLDPESAVGLRLPRGPAPVLLRAPR